MKFKAERTHNLIYIEKSPYKLIVIDQEPFDWTSVTFEVESDNRQIMISGRDVQQYTPEVKDVSIDPSKVYIEVGAGLGEFIHLAAQQNPVQKPIVIDPVNYSLLLDMLQFAEVFGLQGETAQRIRLYQERCKTILNPDQIQLINCKMENALRKHPELVESADVVVDHYAAGYYGNLDAIVNLELRLLKPTGRLYSSQLHSFLKR